MKFLDYILSDIRVAGQHRLRAQDSKIQINIRNSGSFRTDLGAKSF